MAETNVGSTLHIFDYQRARPSVAPVNVVFGDEPFLKQMAVALLRDQALAGSDVPYVQLEGDKAEWRDVIDELSTASLFDAGGKRLVVVSEADPFVTKYRARLEGYVDHPAPHGVLILAVTKWAANTRLYKLVHQHGLQLECRAPLTGRGRSAAVDQSRVARWLIGRAKASHQVRLQPEAARTLLEILGPEFGLLDQEVARLALYTDSGGQITVDLVREYAGGWQTKTIWQVMDAALDGHAESALQHLGRLFLSGQDPAALIGPICWTLRRYAAATRAYQLAERSGRRVRLAAALEQAGFRGSQMLRQSETRLRRLGRERAGQLYRWCLETDLALKGSHSAPALARLTLERLIVRVALA